MPTIRFCSAIAMIRNASVFFEWDLFVEPPADPLLIEVKTGIDGRLSRAGSVHRSVDHAQLIDLGSAAAVKADDAPAGRGGVNDAASGR